MRAAALFCFAIAPLMAQDLSSAIRAASSGTDFVGYEITMAKGHGTVCSSWNGSINSRQDQLMLDGPRKLRILFEIKEGKPGKMLLASEDCKLEPGTKSVRMIPNVSAESSIRYLSTREDELSLYALSLHDHPQATRSLISLAQDSSNRNRQRRAFFWLARSKDPAVDAFFQRVLR